MSADFDRTYALDQIAWVATRQAIFNTYYWHQIVGIQSEKAVLDLWLRAAKRGYLEADYVGVGFIPPFRLRPEEPSLVTYHTPAPRNGFVLVFRGPSEDGDLIATYPFSSDGVQIKLKVDGIELSADRSMAVFHGSTMKGFRLSWHQWDFSSTRAVNVVGSVHEFVMMGFAHLFGRYKDGQFLYPTRLFGEFFPQVGGFPDPRITHDTYPLVLSGENDLLPCYYYVRGAVVKVAQAFWSDPSCTMHQIDIQLELGEATDIKFPVLLSNHVVGKDTLPKVGEVVHAVVRMQARIWLANQQVLQGMKDSHSMHQ